VSSICLCYIENVSKARIYYAVRKLAKKSSARILVCLLSEVRRRSLPLLDMKKIGRAR